MIKSRYLSFLINDRGGRALWSGSPPPDRGGEASGCQGGAQSTKWVSVTQGQVLVLVLLVHLTLTFPSSLVTLLLSSGDTW